MNKEAFINGFWIELDKIAQGYYSNLGGYPGQTMHAGYGQTMNTQSYQPRTMSTSSFKPPKQDTKSRLKSMGIGAGIGAGVAGLGLSLLLGRRMGRLGGKLQQATRIIGRSRAQTQLARSMQRPGRSVLRNILRWMGNQPLGRGV